MTKTDAYIVLTKSLEKNKQIGAVRILIDGIRNFGIPKKLHDFKDIKIEVNGKSFKLHEFFPAGKLELVQKIFQDTISELELYDFIVRKENTFKLSISTIPPEAPIYIPRFLSNRIEIDESIFKTDCPDVFVFKNSLERYKLSKIAKPHFSASSCSQLSQITCRYNYLDDYEDWVDLKKSAKVPVHLIKYEADQSIFLLEETSSGFDFFRKIGLKKKRVYITEDEFVQQHFESIEVKTSSVCICDTPGMGKTCLLANNARRMTQNCNGRIIAYIQLTTFASDYYKSSKTFTVDQENSLLNVFKYVSAEHAELPLEFAKAEILQVEFFLTALTKFVRTKLCG